MDKIFVFVVCLKQFFWGALPPPRGFGCYQLSAVLTVHATEEGYLSECIVSAQVYRGGSDSWLKRETDTLNFVLKENSVETLGLQFDAKISSQRQTKIASAFRHSSLLRCH